MNDHAPEFRILMVTGGTGGHIFPALAVAEELRRRTEQGGPEFDIQFVGTQRPLEAKLIPAAGFRLRTVHSAGLKGIHGIQRFRNLAVLPHSLIQVSKILGDFKPHVVLGVGGYLAGPVMLEAALAGIGTVLIEPNAWPGFTNRLLAPVVRAAAVGFEDTARLFGGKALVTGHPVRREFFQIPPYRHSRSSSFTVLVMGGSQGARAINKVAADAFGLAAQVQVAIRIVHQTGERDYNDLRAVYQEKGLSAEVYAFIDDVPEMLAQADLVIARAGATTVAELAAAGRAALLIPFPGATDQHQLENARALEKVEAARVIAQSQLTPERLAVEVREMLIDPARLERMATSARRLARPDAAARIADMVEDLARRA